MCATKIKENKSTISCGNNQPCLFNHRVSKHPVVEDLLCQNSPVDSKENDTMFLTERLARKHELPPEPKKKRKTYPQNWETYNEAQINEKARFLEFLYLLCQKIEDIPRKKGAGRNRISFKDMVFAVVYKTYTGISARRFQTDLRKAKLDGLIEKVPHFNSLYNYLELEDMHFVLKDMITKSALPLKAIESDFAVDASGFSKGTRSTWMHQKFSNPHAIQKKDWLKCHLICGVTTNIVTSVEITEGTSHDYNQFKPLIEDTSKHFDIAEVSADKAYLSAENLRIVENKGGVAFIPFKGNSRPNHQTKDKLWENMYYFFKMHNDKFKEFYHKRSNVETTFFMIKQKFGERLKSKTEKAQINELLIKVLCHNLCCVVKAVYEFDIDLDFIME